MFDAVIDSYPDTAPRPRRLAELYPSFSLLFPHAHVGPHEVCSARNLLESMGVQMRQYEDWLEVMEDYATVFSHQDEELRQRASAELLVYGGSSPRTLHYRVKSSRPDVCNM
jgi:hypothetical protein